MSVVSVVEPINILFRKFFGSKSGKERTQEEQAEKTPHFYAMSPIQKFNYNAHAVRDSWRKKFSMFMPPESGVYPVGYDIQY